MQLGPMEQLVYEQMIAEYPAMAEEGKTFTYNKYRNGRAFDSPEEVVYLLTNQMWDAFDEALDCIEEKGEQYGES
jgi:DNA repair protein RadC